HIIHIEQCAEVPPARGKNPAFPEKARIERGPGKGGEHRDLDVVQGHLHGEVEDLLKDRWRLSVQTENETTVDGNPLGLNPAHRFDVGTGAAALEIRSEFDPFQGAPIWAF